MANESFTTKLKKLHKLELAWAKKKEEVINREPCAKVFAFQLSTEELYYAYRETLGACLNALSGCATVIDTLEAKMKNEGVPKETQRAVLECVDKARKVRELLSKKV
jgi:uncharacterized repeat protein (TIGR04076 family)